MIHMEASKLLASAPISLYKSCRFVSRHSKKVAREDTVFQHAGKNTKRADRVYGWGTCGTGALGIKTLIKPRKHQAGRSVQFVPYRIGFFDTLGIKINNISCGYGSTLFSVVNKSSELEAVYGCGVNTDSQVGLIEEPPRSGRFLDYVAEPVQIKLPAQDHKNLTILSMGAGRAHSVICTNEAVFTLGHNGYGQCGRKVIPDEVYRGVETLTRLPLDFTVTQVECGQDHTLLLSESGELYSCGLSSDGQTGMGTHDLVEQVGKVKGDVDGETIVSVSSRVDCALAVNDKGDVFGWGNNEYDQLCALDTSESQVATPQRLPFTGIGRAVKVAAAGAVCAVLNSEGNVYVWGYGIVGKGPHVEHLKEPSLLPPTLFGRNEYAPDAKVVDIKCGVNFFAALTNTGDVYTWGKNHTACLGLGDTKDQFFPFKVHVPAEVHRIHCGIDHMMVQGKSFV